jgi:CBS domain-containing protein
MAVARRGSPVAELFDFSTPPFDRLRPAEVRRVAAAVDVVFLRERQTVLRAGDLPDWFYVLIKGAIEERAGDEVLELHGPGDGFDSEILVHGACRHDFVVREEAICYRLPIEDFLELTANNTQFAAFFLKDISAKLEALAQRRASPDALGAMTVRVGQAQLSPPVRIAPEASLHEAAVEMDRQGQRALLVELGGRVGIVTGVDLTRAAVRDRRPLETPVGEVAHMQLIDVDADDFIAEAALIMARNKVRHLAVRRDGEICGLLDAANALASLASQADVVGGQIERATRIEELIDASERVTQLIRQLHGSGTKIGFVTSLASELNARIAARLWELIADAELVHSSCLLVMGSEGRQEQILKTDQDNGVIVADGYEPRDLAPTTARFSEAMIACGFPACPGEVMARNPAWSKPLAAWKGSLLGWIMQPTEQALMDMAIFYDALAIAGDATLLERAKGHLFELLSGNQAFCARFAKAIDSFETPLGILGNFIVEKGEHKDQLDIKKGGVFPIVHGVRALALERSLRETGTVPRIRRLAEQGVLDRELASQLIDAFSALLGLRLQARLEKMRLHQPLDNFIRPADLSKLERDLLKESLRIAKRLKDLVRRHFHLAAF